MDNDGVVFLRPVHSEPEVRDWIVIQGTLINTEIGGGFEFFGPFTEDEAKHAFVNPQIDRPEVGTFIVQLLNLPSHLALPEDTRLSV
jgi:hypothetical protein